MRCKVSDATIEVALPAAPLQLVLRLAGIDGRRTLIPWLGRELTLRLVDPSR